MVGIAMPQFQYGIPVSNVEVSYSMLRHIRVGGLHHQSHLFALFFPVGMRS